MARRCVKYKMTDSGRKVCSKYDSDGGESDHAIVGLKLGNFNPLGRAVNSTDVLAGALVGIAGGFGVKYLIGKYAPASLPPMVTNFLPFIGPAVTGVALKYAQMKNPTRGAGHFVGAVAAGAAMQAWNYGKQTFPEFADVVALPNYGYNNYGLLVQDQSNPFGLLVQDNTQNTLNELSAISDATEDDGLDDLIG